MFIVCRIIYIKGSIGSEVKNIPAKRTMARGSGHSAKLNAFWPTNMANCTSTSSSNPGLSSGMMALAFQRHSQNSL